MELLSCAFHERVGMARPSMLGVVFDRFQDQVKFVGTVDLARDRVKAVGFEVEGFGEVIQAVGPLGRMVFHDKHRAFDRVLTMNESQMIGAEVKHRIELGREKEKEERRPEGPPAPPAAPLWGSPGGLLPSGVSSQRGA